MSTKKKVQKFLHFYAQTADGEFVRGIDFFTDPVEAIQALAESRRSPNILTSELINVDQMHEIFSAGYKALQDARHKAALPFNPPSPLK